MYSFFLSLIGGGVRGKHWPIDHWVALLNTKMNNNNTQPLVSFVVFSEILFLFVVRQSIRKIQKKTIPVLINASTLKNTNNKVRETAVNTD